MSPVVDKIDAKRFANHAISLAFVDGELEREYGDERARRSLRHLRLLFLILSFFGALGGLVSSVDGVFNYFEDSSWLDREALQTRMMLVDFGFVMMTSIIMFAMSFLPIFLRWHQTLVSVFLFLFIPVAIYPLLIAPHDIAMLGFPLFVLHLFTIHMLGRLRFIFATAATTIGGAVYVLAMSFWLDWSPAEIPLQVFIFLVVKALAMFGSWRLETYSRRDFVNRRLLEQERAKSDALLLNILPTSIANRLKEGEEPIADSFDDASILFADIVGFTPLSKDLPPEELVEMLNQLFREFDMAAQKRGLEKIKTIGDAYMVAGGIPQRRDDHAEAVAGLALEMQRICRNFGAKRGELSIQLRIGLHRGAVVAGVIGRTKFSYDLWGDAVNTAARMESHGEPGTIQVSRDFADGLGDRFRLSELRTIEIKGKGAMEVCFLEADVPTR